MPETYTIAKARTELTRLCRSGRKFVITTSRNKPVYVALPVADFEALLETLDVLSDPKAMKAIRDAEAGKTKYRTLDLDDKNFGL